MFETFDKDRYFIERKYHDPDAPFDPYKRMAYHGEGYDIDSGLDDEDIKRGLEAMKGRLSSLPHPVAKALAVAYVLEHQRLYVGEHDYFTGLYSLNRLANCVTSDVWSKQAQQKRSPELVERENLFNLSGAVDMWPDYDHVVPDWSALMRLGFKGVKERAAAYREMREKESGLSESQRAFFDGIEIEYDAVIALIDRIYRLALTKSHEKAGAIAVCMRHLRDGAPTDIYEAMQLIYLYFLVSECVDAFQVRSLGNGLDATLWEFYRRDIDEGRYTRGEIKNLIAYFLMQWSAIGNYWGQPFYLGGTDRQGNTRINRLSYDIVDVYCRLGIYNPKIQIKYNKNIPPDFLNKVLDMIRKGQNCFVFCCEPGMIKAVMSYGATYDEAREMDIRGCYETGVRGNEVSSVSAYINAVKAVQYALSDGFDVGCGKQIGIKTGRAEEFKRFEDFYGAVLSQWSYLIETALSIAADFERFFAFVNPSSLYSATVETSLKNAADGYQGGVKFNNSSVLNCAFASMVNCVMAVKKFVYDNAGTTLPELCDALKNNWKGYESLQAKIRACPYKYGNGERETDLYAAMLARYFANKVNNRPNARGGVYKAFMHSAMMFVWQGKKTPATPDGRNSGDELSKNASPSPGTDKQGATALIHSAAGLIPALYPEGFCVDLMLHPSAVSGSDGFIAMKALLDTYMEHDGMAIQMNVFNAETLKDAQKHPEKYKNLQVRVCGWNVLWNHLSKAEQDAYIIRAEAER